MVQQSGLKISVIVCTYKRVKHLIRCLDALANQKYPGDQYEVIIVDNDPKNNNKSEDTEHLILPDFPCQLSYFHCSTIGLSNARNTGLLHAKGGIICFIDDDAIAPPNWLTTMQTAFREHPQAGVIGGHILLKIPEPRPKILKPDFETFWSQFITKFTEYTEVEAWNDFPWGANWCARKSALTRIGGFKNTYGRIGKNYWGGEELVAAYEIRKLGYSIGIEPRSVILHCVEPKRFSFIHLWRTILAEQFVRYQAQKDGYITKNKRPKKTAKNKHTYPLLITLKATAKIILISYKIIELLLPRP